MTSDEKWPKSDNNIRGEPELADQAFSRAAGAPLTTGNFVRLLKDAKENYPAWLEAIRAAKHHVHFESYIIHEDDAGRKFAEAFIAKAKQGVRVRVLYDWMGGLGNTSRRFWNRLRAGGVEVRCYNPPRLDSPFAWVSRDHRKMLAVDGQAAFIAGLCVGMMWVGDPARNIAPWRDTGVELRGKAVEEAERAFQHVWAMLGERIPNEERPNTDKPTTLGDTSVRVVPSMPATAGMLRLDELVAALARNRLWLTDAYFAGTTSYIQGLRAAARDGIDVRLLVPNATDVRALKLLSRAGYRPLLEAGVRVFEWNGTMLHAKTAVADSRWSRVGSTNLNIASWFGNCELDVVVEDEAFAKEMEEMYLQDLKNATEVILDERNKVRAPGEPLHPQPIVTSGGGSASRAAAGAVRIGNAVGAAFVNRRVFEPVDARIMLIVGALFFGLAILLVFYPGALIKPVIVLFVWFGLALLYKACRLRWGRKQNVWNPADLNRPTGGG